MAPELYDSRRCLLGEGPLWHPLRRQIFWLDIEDRKLLSRTKTGPLEWQFDEHVSAAGWIDENRLLIASETGLYDFDTATGESRLVVAVETDNPETRSNDGRADTHDGFWFGAMGNKGEAGAGALYRYHRGGLRRLVDFSASGSIPDGAVVDREGRLWIAIWNAGTVVCCNARGGIVETHALPARDVTCPGVVGQAEPAVRLG